MRVRTVSGEGGKSEGEGGKSEVSRPHARNTLALPSRSRTVHHVRRVHPVPGKPRPARHQRQCFMPQIWGVSLLHESDSIAHELVGT